MRAKVSISPGSVREKRGAGIVILQNGAIDAAEVEFLASLSVPFAHGVRTGMPARLAGAWPPASVTDPAVVIIGPDDRIAQMSLGAERRLAEIALGDAGGDPLGPISGLIGAARRYGRGETAVPPRCRLRTTTGMWLVLHAGPLTAYGDRQGEVVITIEEPAHRRSCRSSSPHYGALPTRARRGPPGAAG